MRRRDGRVCGTGEFFLGKGSRHDFGPSTIQLKDNWRMVSEAGEGVKNSFFFFFSLSLHVGTLN